MRTTYLKCRVIALPVAAVMFLVGVAPRTELLAMPTDSVTAAVQQAAEQRRRDEANVREFLTDQTVRQKLTQMGLQPEQIESRLSHLSDAQLREVAAQVNQIHSGGWHGVVIAVAVVALLVLLVWFIVEHSH